MSASEAAAKVPITVLISGSGTNLQALIDAQPRAPYRITRVISNKKDAFGLVRAATAGIATAYHNLIAGGYRRRFAADEATARRAYDADLAELILRDEPPPRLVVCAGWMHVLAEPFLARLKEAGVEIVNLHPALPGAYNGARAIERAHADFLQGKTDGTGVMIHYVISEVDMGEPILVVPIPLSHPEDDDIGRLEQRIHDIEHEAIVKGTIMAIERLPSQQRPSVSGIDAPS